MGAVLTPWGSEEDLSEKSLESIFRDEGLRPRWWSNGPGHLYGAHGHSYHKVLYCARGSIRFDLPASGESYELCPGDRLDIPPGTQHSAVVGLEGVKCLEAARSA